MVSCSPLEPGPRPSNSSDESFRMWARMRSLENVARAVSGEIDPREQLETAAIVVQARTDFHTRFDLKNFMEVSVAAQSAVEAATLDIMARGYRPNLSLSSGVGWRTLGAPISRLALCASVPPPIGRLAFPGYRLRGRSLIFLRTHFSKSGHYPYAV